MNQAGEYPSPLIRVSNLQVPMVSGYATGRLRAQFGPVSGTEDSSCLILLENVGPTTFTVQLKEAAAVTSVSGRSNLGEAYALAVNGRRTVRLTPSQPIVEAWCTAGSGQLKAQIQSQLRWDILAFDRDEASYPTQVWRTWDPNLPQTPIS